MIALTVTQEIKDLNDLSNAVGSILTSSNYPDEWVNDTGRVMGYQNRTDLHEPDGWRDVVQPTIGENQVRGAIFFDEPNNVFTYAVVDLTTEQIQQNLISQSEAQKQDLIQKIQEEKVVAEAQEFDDTSALDNQALFPFWAPDQTYTLNQKCQFPVGNEIWLFKINQPTLVTSELNPPNSAGSEALYTRVAYPNQILAWQQPISSVDAYALGARVYHDRPQDGGNLWVFESLIPANTTEPGRDGTFDRYWQPIEPYNG